MTDLAADAQKKLTISEKRFIPEGWWMSIR